jgi:hypothetical protein
MTWDFDLDDELDPVAIGTYVRDALAQYDYFRANAAEVARQAKEAHEKAKKR